MNGEFDISGVFVPSLGVWMLIAFAVTALVRRRLVASRFYRLVWHQALFDFALYIVVLGLVAVVANRIVT
jgi:hypothetical protein